MYDTLFLYIPVLPQNEWGSEKCVSDDVQVYEKLSINPYLESLQKSSAPWLKSKINITQTVSWHT